ncbi:MAG: glutamate 5-kinase [Gemmataceae bacterium]|jgi:glutamate 5-kinase|nr:glutamate 5-kinase [Gemmataceae bacterium]NBT61851.1 glutamate 5-kinase [Planctomycetia bacterium]
MDAERKEILKNSETIVIKVGTNVLTRADGTLEPNQVHSLADQIFRLKQAGKKVALVSSGAIGAGMGRLGLKQRPTDLRHLQACAAVGQSFLMRAYEDSLARYGIPTAQILLTAGDFDNRTRYLNVRNTILTLFESNCLPIINENDTISVAEIRFGDNDTLAALVTNLIQAPLLILLTVVDGLYSADPNIDPTASLVHTVKQINKDVLEKAGVTKSSLGSGGMKSKLKAARLATMAGESVIMANGSIPGVLDSIFAGELVGTLFLAAEQNMTAWKRWLGWAARPQGKIILDAGALVALSSKGKSLLPIGVAGVSGTFHKGAVVSLCNLEGEEFGRGLSNYSASDIAKIAGKKSDKIIELLGILPYEEVIHRDNLVIIDNP